MLDAVTKQKIDSARDILVGKVPDPKAQVEQITIALIYKFMDDMDKQRVFEEGTKFFGGDFEKYSWGNLLDNSLSGQERLSLYISALADLSKAPHWTQLFRDIFKGAFLPYNDPRTLYLFLKEINGFKYEHSEDLGDAFEYLLSILGSQGDAGQFRTPRHIIDFIVEIIDPKKDETILDPACGTAGFLISSYKHILKQNKKTPLTPAQKVRLANSLTGYDISPDMAKLSRVNMYLHDFTAPQIYEYDSLTDQSRWNDNFDVILANPPFMTPKGGIEPHQKFTARANRSEVLFVDYILEHLKNNGRAGIIVPEGIISRGDNAYKQLRKISLDNGLFAVISLPTGVFKPYSGVKTSILIFDKKLAKERDEILFIKIENDGYDLGDNRRPIDKNDLPQALKVLQAWKEGNKIKTFKMDSRLRGNNNSAVTPVKTGVSVNSNAVPSYPDIERKKDNLALWIKKKKIEENEICDFRGDGYKKSETLINNKYEMVKLGEVCQILNGYSFKPKKYVNNGIRVIRISDVQKGVISNKSLKFYPLESEKDIEKYLLNDMDLVMSLTGNVGRVAVLSKSDLPAGLNQRVACLRPKQDKILTKFLFYFLNSDEFENAAMANANNSGRKNMSTTWLGKYLIPLPPLSVQQEIIDRIEVKQNAINSARKIIRSLERERDNILPTALKK